MENRQVVAIVAMLDAVHLARESVAFLDRPAVLRSMVLAGCPLGQAEVLADVAFGLPEC